MSENIQKNVWSGYKKPSKNKRVLERKKRLSGDSHETTKTKKIKPAKVPPLNTVSVLLCLQN